MRALQIFIIAFCFAACASQQDQAVNEAVSVIPKPVQMEVGDDVLQWDEPLHITAKSDEEKQVATLLEKYLEDRGLTVSLEESAGNAGGIQLLLSKNPEFRNEGYRLSINNKGVNIHANSGAGLFYGSQTLLQLIRPDGPRVPFVEITDYPRFAYRGLHLDVARHMFPTEFIKRYIDLLARHKFNRFHWHLTDDQGWRIEIKKYPQLQKVAAYRDETIIGHASAKTGDQAAYDGQRYGGLMRRLKIIFVNRFTASGTLPATLIRISGISFLAMIIPVNIFW